ncbi:MAG: hypothetical protein WKI04_05765 [Ferruginibacter sp.]
MYRQLPNEMFTSWKTCEPLSQVPPGRAIQSEDYKPWKAVN